MNLTGLRPFYKDSHAMVIGVNKYTSAPPLGCAVNDAEAVADILVKELRFPSENVYLLTDKRATRAAIMQSFLLFASRDMNADDRLLFFFAGHGHTVSSSKGEVGFLVPQDGDIQDLSTLIRWDELTRSADLIEPKHVLFIMDACYGGLAIKRALKPGSMRFLKDLLLRRARQVLTAGKADELVADLGGPLPDHSVFTGYLLEALGGKAASPEGLLTANGVMAYVQYQVGNDPDSEQTPHYGYLDGDGDFVFSDIDFLKTQSDEKKDQETLISVPAVLTEKGETMTVVNKAKEFLSEEKHRIQLHDLVIEQTRLVMSLTAEDSFSVTDRWSVDESLKRISKYEKATADLRGTQTLLAFWGTGQHVATITLPVRQMGGRLEAKSGITSWLSLRWYPLHANRPVTLVGNVGRCGSELDSVFKELPEHARHYVPRSEYLFTFLQPELDDVLFLGTDYEWCFDEFEVLFALEYAEEHESEFGNIRGPLGRFAWKYGGMNGSNPFGRILAQADEQGESWLPIKAGLFKGNIERFRVVAKGFNDYLAKLNWN